MLKYILRWWIMEENMLRVCREKRECEWVDEWVRESRQKKLPIKLWGYNHFTHCLLWNHLCQEDGWLTVTTGGKGVFHKKDPAKWKTLKPQDHYVIHETGNCWSQSGQKKTKQVPVVMCYMFIVFPVPVLQLRGLGTRRAISLTTE